MNEYTAQDLVKFQLESLDKKFQRSFGLVSSWFSRWNNQVYVSFSGGKDSTVLADICARWCKIVGCALYLVFSNTGLEFPEIRKNVEEVANYLRKKYEIEVVLEIIRPEMRFDQVIKKYGYPLISKDVSQRIRKAKTSINKGKFSYRLRQLDVRRDEYGGLYDSGEFDYDKGIENSKYYTPKYRPLLDVDFLISEQCCDVMKKKPFAEYERRTGRVPIIGTLAEESINRKTSWYKYGCNAFQAKKPSSRPLSFWTEQDILQFIKEEQDNYDQEYNAMIAKIRDLRYHGSSRRTIRKWLLKEYECPTRLPLASVYGEIVKTDDGHFKTTLCDRTGCMFCAFGCTQESDPRFVRLQETHSRQYEYCIGGGEYVWVGEHRDNNNHWKEFDLINDDGTPMSKDDIENFMDSVSLNNNFRFKKMWQPSESGLGFGHVFDELNDIFGKDFIRYGSENVDNKS